MNEQHDALPSFRWLSQATLRVTFWLVCACALLPHGARAALVHLAFEGGQGRGIAALRGTECIVLAPAHIVPASARKRVGPTPIRITGPLGARVDGTFLSDVGNEKDDLALLRANGGGNTICNESESASLAGRSGTYLVARDPNGDLSFVPVSVLRETSYDIELGESTIDSRFAQGMSGAALYVDGDKLGIMLSASTGKKRARARSLQFAATMVGTWLLDGSKDLSMLSSALAIVEMATVRKPTGDFGQVAAIEELVRAGSGLSGSDLRGVFLGNAFLADAKLDKSMLSGANLRQSVLRQARLNYSDIDFADLSSAEFTNADLSGARLYFVDAADSEMRGIKAARSNWFGAGLQNADFTGADLRGAAFTFSDLRGARFTGANLTDALFYGAVLDRAVFDGAMVSNTDFTSATVVNDQLSKSQLDGACARSRDDYMSVQLVRKVPSSRYESGFEFDELLYGQYFESSSGLANLPPCRALAENEMPLGRTLVWGGQGAVPVQKFVGDTSFYHLADLLDKAGRERGFGDRIRRQTALLAEIRSPERRLARQSAAGDERFEAVRAAMSTSSLVGPLFFNTQTFSLYGLALDESAAAQFDWEALARKHVESEKNTDTPKKIDNAQIVRSSPLNVWEPVFPPDTLPEMIDSQLAELFRDWTLERARTLPKRFYWRIYGSNFRSKFKTAKGAFELVLNPEEANADRQAYTMSSSESGKALPTGVDTPFGQVVLRFARPVASLPLSTPLADMHRVFIARPPVVALDLLRLERAIVDGEEALVADVELMGVYQKP